MNAPIYGLVLAGGRSTRMRSDKAALTYHHTTQLEWTMAFLKPPSVARAFVSVRPDQAQDPLRARFDCIQDKHENIGPIAGIVAAQSQHPEAAWLVLACDLPFLDADTLQHLISARRPDRLATSYRSAWDGAPEPLCAIYEPASRHAILSYLLSGKHCPRKFLLQSEVALVDQPNPRALTNVNTPEDYAAHAHAHTGAAANPTKTIKVQYFALLRDQAGRREELVNTAARTPSELYDELRRRYAFPPAPGLLRVAVNAEFGDWSQPLHEGDSVVFIPPVAGG